MKSRQDRIDFHRNYCRHYTHGSRPGMVCAKGMDLKTVMVVPTGGDGRKWGPCIYGHTLPHPTSHCPHWERRTQEEGEAYADSVEKSFVRMTKVLPAIAQWKKTGPQGKSGTIICPACGGTLSLVESSYNGHIQAQCLTEGCIAFIE